jgi:hypothetical protein
MPFHGRKEKNTNPTDRQHAQIASRTCQHGPFSHFANPNPLPSDDKQHHGEGDRFWIFKWNATPAFVPSAC